MTVVVVPETQIYTYVYIWVSGSKESQINNKPSLYTRTTKSIHIYILSIQIDENSSY